MISEDVDFEKYRPLSGGILVNGRRDLVVRFARRARYREHASNNELGGRQQSSRHDCIAFVRLHAQSWTHSYINFALQRDRH